MGFRVSGFSPNYLAFALLFQILAPKILNRAPTRNQRDEPHLLTFGGGLIVASRAQESFLLSRRIPDTGKQTEKIYRDPCTCLKG